MKKQTTMVLFGAVFAVTLGMLGVNGLFALPGWAQPSQVNTMTGTAPIMGHVTLTLYDADGNIKAYRQTDNQIVNQGENCIAEALFAADETTSATESCGGITAGGVSASKFTFVAEGTGTTAVAANQAALVAQVESRTQDSSVTFTKSTGTGTTTGTVVVDGAISQLATQTITEAGLFDASTAGNMFARQTFTGISVVSGDSLTIKWTLTIGS